MENCSKTSCKNLDIVENYNLMINISEIIFHDFKNILATISGLAQLSMLYTQSEEVKINLKNITNATFDLRDGLNRYYNFTHGLSDELQNSYTISKIVSDTLDLIQFKFGLLNSTDHKVSLMLNINSSSKVWCNEYELKQSFLNLMMNALESMEEMGGSLRIEIFNNHDTVFVDIIDSGTGISKDNMEKLFNATFTTKENGTGLGLKIVKNSIEKLGGSIQIASELGIGTIVSISLPIYNDIVNE